MQNTCTVRWFYSDHPILLILLVLEIRGVLLLLFCHGKELLSLAQWAVNSEELHCAPQATRCRIDMCINYFFDLNLGLF